MNKQISEVLQQRDPRPNMRDEPDTLAEAVSQAEDETHLHRRMP